MKVLLSLKSGADGAFGGALGELAKTHLSVDADGMFEYGTASFWLGIGTADGSKLCRSGILPIVIGTSMLAIPWQQLLIVPVSYGKYMFIFAN